MTISQYDESEHQRHAQPSTLDGEQSTGSAHGHADIAALQRSAGNRAVSALAQAKLQVGAVDDPLEAEADRVAAQVIGRIQRQPAAGCGCHDDPAAHVEHDITSVRRSDAGEGVGVAGGALDADTDTALRHASGGGQSLDGDVQRSMEAGFGADFSGVKVHHDGQADQINRQLGARAFTTGSDIYFRGGEYAPSTPDGQELLAHELTHVIQQGAATSTTEQVNRSPDDTLVQRKAYDIGTTGEKLEVSLFVSKSKRKEMLKEAEQIIDELKTTYGVTVSSTTTVDAIKNDYTDVTTKVLNSLRTQPWRIQELRALKRALGHYAAILGANRANSTRSGEDQEVTSVGKVKQAIDEDSSAGKLDTSTLGEYFASKKNMGLFRASERYVEDFSTLEDQLTGTFVHEVAHGLLAYTIPDYIAATGYWLDRSNELPTSQRTEDPITDYGGKNAAEDMCESAMFFFVEPNTLKAKCPKRYAFMKQVGKDWLPPPAQAPQVQPDAPEAVDTDTAPSDGGSDQVPAEVDETLKAIEKVVDKAESTPETGDSDTPTSDDPSDSAPAPPPAPTNPTGGDTTSDTPPAPPPVPASPGPTNGSTSSGGSSWVRGTTPVTLGSHRRRS